MSMLLTHCHVVSPGLELDDAYIQIVNGHIKSVGAMSEAPASSDALSLAGALVMPGFIDVHCHGKLGYDFCDGSVEAVSAISIGKLSEGVTSWLPTTLTLDFATLGKALQSAADCVKSGRNGCRIPGVHLEGPYINPKNLGAQNPAFVRKPDIAEVERLNSIFPVAKVSYAIEAPGAVDFTRELVGRGIQPSCVHSSAKYAEFAAGYAAGLTNLSHFCNQMSPLHHRDIGLVGAGLLHDDVDIELICDKLHVSPEMIKLIFKVKGVDHIQLITDALRCAGMPDGDYTLGGLPFTVKNGEARLPEGNLAGSTLTINRALKNVWELTGLPLAELVKCASFNQARSLGWNDLGKIAPGFRADLAVLDRDFEVRKTFVAGELEFAR